MATLYYTYLQTPLVLVGTQTTFKFMTVNVLESHIYLNIIYTKSLSGIEIQYSNKGLRCLGTYEQTMSIVLHVRNCKTSLFSF